MITCTERLHSHRHASVSCVGERLSKPRCLYQWSGLIAVHRQQIQQSGLVAARIVSCSVGQDAEFSTSAVGLTGEDSFANNDTSCDVSDASVLTQFVAETLLPTKYGNFRLRGYKHSVDGGETCTEPTAIICGSVEDMENVPVRVHDACFTSEVLGSLKCDCAEQLQLALQNIQANPPGIVIYLQQEGRGIGLANKIAAYSLQEQGLDTVDANRALGLPDDCREYTSVRNILKDLRVQSIQLITNNPRKINVLLGLGVKVVGRVPCVVAAGQYNQGYLDAKRDRMEHLLDGSWCYWNHDGEPAEPVPTSLVRGGMALPNGLKTAPNGRVLIQMPADGKLT